MYACACVYVCVYVCICVCVYKGETLVYVGEWEGRTGNV